MSSLMLEDARRTPACVARQLSTDAAAYARLGQELRRRAPSSILTIASSSGSNAALYFAYMVMSRLGRLVTSLPMSLLMAYQSRISSQGLMSVALSRSGTNAELISSTRSFRARGARTVAFVNASYSPLADSAEHVFEVQAGSERSAVATSSHVAQLVAAARLVCEWQHDTALRFGINMLPITLEKALTADWHAALPLLRHADRVLVFGRGSGLPAVMEAVSKLQQVCGIRAEAMPMAESTHALTALVHEAHPLIVFAPRGPSQAGLLDFAGEMRQRGARVLLAAPAGTPNTELPFVTAAAEDLDPISLAMSLYPMLDALAHERGREPDSTLRSETLV